MPVSEQIFIQMAQGLEDIAALWLYGSRAKNTHTIDSDYDLGVAFKNYIQDPLEQRLRPELLALDWCESLNLAENKLSIVDVSLAPIPLAFEIVSYGKVLYIADQNIYDKEFGRICSMFEIDIVHHRKHYGA